MENDILYIELLKGRLIMGFIQENIINIDLGLSKEYKLVHFSDVHVATYNVQSDDIDTIKKAKDQEKTWIKQRVDFAEKFNETYDTNYLLPSADCLNNLIDYSNMNYADLVLLTGDIIDYYSLTNYKYLKNALTSLSAPYLFSCGNHESPSHLFKEICQGDCDFNYVNFGEFIVASINNSTRKIKLSQLTALNNLIVNKIPIILAMHIPIMTKYNRDIFIKLDSYYSMRHDDNDEVTNSFIDLVCSSEEVKALLCGHTHGSISSIIAPDKPQYCCSSGLIGHVNKIIVK